MMDLLITCVNYSDYLDYSLRYNLEIFNHIYILTTPEDCLTKNIITKYNNSKTILIETNLFYQDGAHLNKGAALNLGLQNLRNKDWLLIGDTDCIYPYRLKDLVQRLDINYLYGMYRHTIHTSKNLNEEVNIMNTIDSNDEFFSYIMSKHGYAHKLILGYCQLFNFSSKFLENKNLTYPHGKSCRFVDTIFSRSNFSRRYKKLLDTYCIHLGDTGINWTGRKSVIFQ